MTIITNLYAKYAYPFGKTNLPIMVLMHTWGGDASQYDDVTMTRFANYGLFCVAPGMRGRNNASGARDANGREVYDIYDAVIKARTDYASLVSADKVSIVGYSGGGGNALAAAMKFPDLFNCVVSFFGPSDFGNNNPGGWYYNGPAPYPTDIVSSIGDTPANLPGNYYTRDAVSGISNYLGGHLYLYHSTGDTLVPVTHSQRIAAAMAAAGLSNYTASYLDKWAHGFPSSYAPLIDAEADFIPTALNTAAWTVPQTGTLFCGGYLKTKLFEVRLGTFTDHAASVVYDTGANTYIVTPLTAGGIDVTITQDAKTGSATNISTATLITVS